MPASRHAAPLSGLAGITLLDVGWFWGPTPPIDWRLLTLGTFVLPMAGITLWFAAASITLAVSRRAPVVTTADVPEPRSAPSLPLGVPPTDEPRAVARASSGVDLPDTGACCHDVMTPPAPHLPSEATVVDVHGSRFLLEWLDRDVLAAAAALGLRQRVGSGPIRRRGSAPARRDGEGVTGAPTAGTHRSAH